MVEFEGHFFLPPTYPFHSDNEVIWSLGPKPMSNLNIHISAEVISIKGRVHTRPRITDHLATITV